MASLIESAQTEVLVEPAEGVVVELVDSVTFIETTSSGPDLLIDVVVTELTVERVIETVYAVEPSTTLIDVGAQGPAGPPGTAGAQFAAKTLVWASGLLAEVRLYADAAKTTLAERRVLNRSGGELASVSYFSGDGALTKTRTLSYAGGQLVGVSG